MACDALATALLLRLAISYTAEGNPATMSRSHVTAARSVIVF
jgi:hypothetical protein